MLRTTLTPRYRMRMGEMLVDYKVLSRDLRKSARVEGAVVDPTRRFCTAPLHWLEALRSPSLRLPNGYYRERPVYVPAPFEKPPQSPQLAAAAASSSSSSSAPQPPQPQPAPNGIRAGPLLLQIDSEASPVVVHFDFVDPARWNGGAAMRSNDDCDMRIGLEAIEQCTLFHELRPGGLLSKHGISELKRHPTLGIQTGLAESPLASRPWTRMKTYFIDELQRGPALKEYVGYNHRVGHEWRFSQHCKYFRIGIWRESTRRNELVEGPQTHSSFQRSHQQSVPEVRFMAPGP